MVAVAAVGDDDGVAEAVADPDEGVDVGAPAADAVVAADSDWSEPAQPANADETSVAASRSGIRGRKGKAMRMLTILSTLSGLSRMAAGMILGKSR